MTDLQTLFQAVDDLEPDELKQLYTYILENKVQFIQKETLDTPKPRIIGLHAHLGKAWMSDDFDDELPDEFWLGES